VELLRLRTSIDHLQRDGQLVEGTFQRERAGAPGSPHEVVSGMFSGTLLVDSQVRGGTTRVRCVRGRFHNDRSSVSHDRAVPRATAALSARERSSAGWRAAAVA